MTFSTKNSSEQATNSNNNGAQPEWRKTETPEILQNWMPTTRSGAQNQTIKLLETMQMVTQCVPWVIV